MLVGGSSLLVFFVFNNLLLKSILKNLSDKGSKRKKELEVV